MGPRSPIPRLLWCACGLFLLLAVQGVCSEHEPTESECRPYIQKALKDHHVDTDDSSVGNEASSIEQEETPPIDEKSESNEESNSIQNEGSGEENKTEEEGDLGSNENNQSADNSNQDNADSASPTDGDESDTQEQGLSEASVETEEDQKSQEDAADSQEESGEDKNSQEGNDATEEPDSQEGDTAEQVGSEEQGSTVDSQEGDTAEQTESQEGDTAEQTDSQEGDTAEQTDSQEEGTAEQTDSHDGATGEQTDSQEGDTAEQTDSQDGATTEQTDSQEGDTAEQTDSQEGDTAEQADSQEGEQSDSQGDTAEQAKDGDTAEQTDSQEQDTAEQGDSQEGNTAEQTSSEAKEGSVEATTEKQDAQTDSQETTGEVASTETQEQGDEDQTTDTAEESIEKSSENQSQETAEVTISQETSGEASPSQEQAPDTKEDTTSTEASAQAADGESSEEGASQETTETSTQDGSSEDEPVEELSMDFNIPANLRSKEHITQILKLDEDSVIKESELSKTIDTTLTTLKKLYDGAIKPLEILYKYRDLSNRHFGDAEIFSKPLILFMGPWSGGKSSTINYLLDLEFTELALRTGAEPSPAYFNILTYGEETEILDGTQLAADWTFSGLQKFGQGMLDRLRGVRLKHRLLEKVNIVEIPGILEIRKQVQRLFPFNDACQWFIDRADIIFLVYDPAKLDVGPETEAILDQLKGREYQTRIVLNKADQVKPEELMRVQGTLIWNISPLMSSQEPPVMYTTSLWSLPYEDHAPTRLLHAQERAFLRDLREAIDKRIDNKIASARRFAVRVRNHAKMVDCYLTTYYNHKTFFGNKKKTSDDIIENPTKYHIYEGLSTLTNISRYDLPDPEMYRDFFRINPLYDFTKLSDTCTYFRGCPINKLDIAIAYELPELVGKYKKAMELAKTKASDQSKTKS